MEKAIKAVKAEQGAILLLTEMEQAPLKTLIRQQDRMSRMLTYKVGTNITGWVLKHKQPLMIENLATDERFKTTEQEREQLKTVLCVPIQFKAKMIGILTVTNKKTLQPFNANDLRLLSIIAAQSGQLIRNSQLQAEALEKERMQHELEMARDIQMSLLPKSVPESKGLDIASYFKSADHVGGDYFDYFSLSEDRLGIVLADVSGHGASSALVMTMVKGVIHTIAQHFQSSDALLKELNLILGKTIPKEMFVTMMFLEFDLKRKVLKYSNAGHNPLLFFDAKNKKTDMLELKGPALGLTNLSIYQEKELPLNAGDLFFVYTDGVTEAFNKEDQMFEEHRLLEAAEEVVSESAQKIIDHIQSKLRDFIKDAPQSDDVAMIAIKVI